MCILREPSQTVLEVSRKLTPRGGAAEEYERTVERLGDYRPDDVVRRDGLQRHTSFLELFDSELAPAEHGIFLNLTGQIVLLLTSQVVEGQSTPVSRPLLAQFKEVLEGLQVVGKRWPLPLAGYCRHDIAIEPVESG